MIKTNGLSKNTPSHQADESGRKRVDLRILEARKKLPIWQGKNTIVEAVRDNDTVVILGETGCGKTTQIPQYLYEAGFASGSSSSSPTQSKSQYTIGITQPRRVAAISLAKRIAVEMGVSEPSRDDRKTKRSSSLVGYSIRFDDRSGQNTRIQFMTDGWLLREMLSVKGKKKGKAKAVDDKETSINGVVNEEEAHIKLQHSLLERFSILIIDEAHERSVHTDVVLGLAKRIQKERKKIREDWLNRQKFGQLRHDDGSQAPKELKLVIMSATIDAESFARFFSDEDSKPAPILYIKGRQYPIKLMHSMEPCTNWMDSCKKLIIQINDLPPGGILVFMTGAEEIDTFASELEDVNRGLEIYAEGMGNPRPMNLVIVKLYAALGSEAIRKCFLTTPPGSRKVVLATNIAETSITISGIKFVIDCGLAKERTFRTANATSTGVSGGSMDMLETKPISKSAARQRAGRAGRESGGTCFRLYKEDIFDSLPDSTLPEILRTDLSSVILDVFAMGLDPVNFDWLDRPEEESLKAAILNLVELDALEMGCGKIVASQHEQVEHQGSNLQLTNLGAEMAKLPLLPQLSKTLLSARDCKDGQVFLQALDLVSILSTERRSILIEPTSRNDDASGRKRDEADRARERLSHPSGDHATQLKALTAFHRIEEEKSQTDGTPTVKTTTNGKAVSKLQDWCNLNYVSLKTVREAMRIRGQLEQICIKQGWLHSDALRIPQKRKGIEEEEEASSDGSEDSQGRLSVHKGPQMDLSSGHAIESKDDYAMLRRCLVQGKRNNTAFRQGESNLYQRAHGGEERFKIHPSSSLHFRKPLPNVIFFEDIFVTTQIFARTVSAAEASWLSEISGEVTNRKDLQQIGL